MTGEHDKSLEEWANEAAGVLNAAQEDGWRIGLWYGQDLVVYNSNNHEEYEVIW